MTKKTKQKNNGMNAAEPDLKSKVSDYACHAQTNSGVVTKNT